jgi:hypothetical protein
MSTLHDLDALDAATLRGWRMLNLVGWGIAGAVAALAVTTVVGLVTQRLYEQGHSWSNAVALLSTLAAGAIAGALVGAKVYRLPGTVAFLGQVAVFVGWTVWEIVVIGEDQQPFAIALGAVLWLLVAIPAVLVARLVWRRRPAALRAGPTALAPATLAGTPAAPGTPGR